MNYTRRAKTIILEFLQDAFSQDDLVDGENEYLWSPEEEESKILIADSFTDSLEVVGQKPALLVNRGPLSYMNIGIDQMVYKNMRSGATRHKDNIKTSVRINCFARNGQVAEELAVMVFSMIQFFAEGIRKRGAFEINSLSVGQESLIESDDKAQLSVVPVEIGLYFTDNWVWSQGNDGRYLRHDKTGIRIHTEDDSIDRSIET